MIGGENMATSSKLVMTFANSNGTEHSIIYNYVDANTADVTVKALVNGIIANGSIFSNVPATAKSAAIVTTTQTAVDLSN